MSRQPNPLVVAWSIGGSLHRTRPPRPRGNRLCGPCSLTSPLERLAAGPPEELVEIAPELTSYVHAMKDVDPDRLSRDEALASWVNLYNSGALLLAGAAWHRGEGSVLRVPGGFRRPVVEVAGEALSLDDIEHGKLRRFRDPRIHTALVCGSVSCPTLRRTPYTGPDLDGQLGDQTRRFLASGGYVPDRRSGTVSLSRVFLRFGGDFVRPHRMPTLLPASPRGIVEALTPWMDPAEAEWVRSSRPSVVLQGYDWGLRCAVG